MNVSLVVNAMTASAAEIVSSDLLLCGIILVFSLALSFSSTAFDNPFDNPHPALRGDKGLEAAGLDVFDSSGSVISAISDSALALSALRFRRRSCRSFRRLELGDRSPLFVVESPSLEGTLEDLEDPSRFRLPGGPTLVLSMCGAPDGSTAGSDLLRRLLLRGPFGSSSAGIAVSFAGIVC